MSKEKIRATIETIYGEVFNKGKTDLLPGLIAGPYIQHNPVFPNGPEPLMGSVEPSNDVNKTPQAKGVQI